MLEHTGAGDLLEVRDAEGLTPFMVAVQVGEHLPSSLDTLFPLQRGSLDCVVQLIGKVNMREIDEHRLEEILSGGANVGMRDEIHS